LDEQQLMPAQKAWIPTRTPLCNCPASSIRTTA